MVSLFWFTLCELLCLYTRLRRFSFLVHFKRHLFPGRVMLLTRQWAQFLSPVYFWRPPTDWLVLWCLFCVVGRYQGEDSNGRVGGGLTSCKLVIATSNTLTGLSPQESKGDIRHFVKSKFWWARKIPWEHQAPQHRGRDRTLEHSTPRTSFVFPSNSLLKAGSSPWLPKVLKMNIWKYSSIWEKKLRIS